MSDNVEVDDNMIVLVVGDEGNSKDDPLRKIKTRNTPRKDQQQDHAPYPITFKIEPLEDSTVYDPETNILEEDPNGEADYEVEYLEELPVEFQCDQEKYDDKLKDQHATDEDYKTDEDQEDSEDQESSDSEYKRSSKRTLRKRRSKGTTLHKQTWQRRKPQSNSTQNKTKAKITKKKFISFVQQLRDENPAMAQDEQMLINHLAVLMRDTTPPAPPDKHCRRIDTDEGIPKFECSFCGTFTATEAAAARHYQYKHGEFYLSCYACGRTYSNTPNLYKHEKRCRAPDTPIVLRARGQYLGRKGRGRPFTTTTKFVTKNTFVKQEKSASGEYVRRRFYCAKCPASFVHRDNLDAHENSHEGRRPYRCDKCPASYASYVQYKRHLNLHGDYQYICDHCGRKFKLKDALVSHLQTHQPLRKHPCLYCERRFAQKSAFLHHMNTVHLNLPGAHGCPVCPKRYAKMSHVKEHMARKHGLTMITAKMFLRAMPTLTDEEVTRATKLFNFEANYSATSKDTLIINQEPEHNLPDVSEEPKSVSEIEPVTIITKRKVDQYKKNVTEETEHKTEENDNEPENNDYQSEDNDYQSQDNDNEPEENDYEPEENDYEPEENECDQNENDFKQEGTDCDEESDYPVEYLEDIDETDEEKSSMKSEKKEKLEKPKPKKKKKRSQLNKRKSKPKPKSKSLIPKPKKVITDPLKIDEEMDVDICNIEYKRKRKSINPKPQNKRNEDDMYKIVRDIKSALTNRKKEVNARADRKKSNQNFYEIKREFINQLKNEIEIPESNEEMLESIVPKKEPREDTSSMDIKVEHDDDDDDEEDWKLYKDATEKNKVVVDFLEYVKTGVVPKRVPILRRGRENTK